jgi:hypothetical protein
LNGSLTFNTDFSAVEVDNRQVNLTRFSLFFPERRDFFLNDADLFEFGRIGGSGFGATLNRAQSRSDRENARPFFSRRIGLDSNNAPVDLEYGGKISGRVGRWNIGTLAIRQDGYQDLDDDGNVVEEIDPTDARRISARFHRHGRRPALEPRQLRLRYRLSLLEHAPAGRTPARG